MNVHLHPCGCLPTIFWCSPPFLVSPVSLSFSVLFSSFFLCSYSLVPASLFIALYFWSQPFPCSSERKGPQTGSICSIFRLLLVGLFILWQEQSFLAGEKKIYRRTAKAPSLSHLSPFNQQESSDCPHLSFSFLNLFLSLPHIKAPLPLYLTLRAV